MLGELCHVEERVSQLEVRKLEKIPAEEERDPRYLKRRKKRRSRGQCRMTPAHLPPPAPQTSATRRARRSETGLETALRSQDRRETHVESGWEDLPPWWGTRSRRGCHGGVSLGSRRSESHMEPLSLSTSAGGRSCLCRLAAQQGSPEH